MDNTTTIIGASCRLVHGSLETGVHWIDETGVERVTHIVRTSDALLVREYQVIDGAAVKVDELHLDRRVEDEERLADVLPLLGLPLLTEAA